MASPVWTGLAENCHVLSIKAAINSRFFGPEGRDSRKRKRFYIGMVLAYLNVKQNEGSVFT